MLSYSQQTYDISFGECPPRFDRTAYACWSIGRKLYYDFTTCGFLSIWDAHPYGGYVHWRPEILSDIDNLFNLTLSNEWHISHKPYKIVATVQGRDVVYDGDDQQSIENKVLNYLTKAVYNRFWRTDRTHLIDEKWRSNTPRRHYRNISFGVLVVNKS